MAGARTSAERGAPGRAARADPPLAIAVVHEDGDWSALTAIERDIARAAEAIAAVIDLGTEPAAAVVALNSDATVRVLNRTYRGKDAPTNVLSFPAASGAREPGAPLPLGDVVLAAGTVHAEAEAGGLTPRDHVLHLVVHGLLHLLGYDHESEADASEMESLEVEILARLAIANPYQPTPDGTAG